MYDELVGDLRYCDKGDCNGCRRYTKDTRFCNVLLREAADAIEELQAGEKKFLRNISALEMENENLKRAGRWIPVTERLPKDEKDVLAYYGFKHDGILSDQRFIGTLCYFRFDPNPHWQHEGQGKLTVTHWMPLPEPPKEEAK